MASTKSYVGVAPLTMARTSSGSYINIYAGDPVPEGVDKDDLKRLVDELFLGEAPDQPQADSADSGPKVATVDDILKDVGDDKAKAAEALKTEEARGDDARSTLVKKLQAIAADGS